MRKGYRVSGEDRPQSGRGRRVTETPLDRSDGAISTSLSSIQRKLQSREQDDTDMERAQHWIQTEQAKAFSRESGSWSQVRLQACPTALAPLT